MIWCALVLALGCPLVSVEAETAKLKSTTSVARGWHPWYEIKADPETETNLIICGTKWDPRINAPFGFVYASQDGGATWHATLEDRSSSWVTEQSCTFGSHHSAYLISEASKVIDGVPHHDEGQSRFFVSADAGEHWVETIKTGWADYSTSAFNSHTGNIYTFYNAWYTTHEPGKAVGGTIGLLVFSPDGKKISGPFVVMAMRDAGYHGVFPMDAVSLKSGEVVALYSAKRESKDGWEEDLGIVRVDPRPTPTLRSFVIAHPTMNGSCFNFDDASLAYDELHDKLFLVYVDGCRAANQIIMTSSDDEGTTWTPNVAVFARDSPDQRLYSPMLAATPRRGLGLLWEEGRDRRSGRWLFSYLQDSHAGREETELSKPSDRYEVRDDSLWTAVDRTDPLGSDNPSDSTLQLTVLSELNNVWRGRGLIAIGNSLMAIWPSENKEGQQLNAGLLDPDSTSAVTRTRGDGFQVRRDVSGQTMMFGGKQHFDPKNGTLEVCFTLANLGMIPLRVPIELETKRIRSPLGQVSILNATNRLPGIGAKWDISSSVTGDEIPPGARSNPFCVSFGLDLSATKISPSESDELVFMELKVAALNERADP